MYMSGVVQTQMRPCVGKEMALFGLKTTKLCEEWSNWLAQKNEASKNGVQNSK